MTARIAGFTHAELIREAMVAPIEVTALMPDSHLTVKPNWWQIITPSLPHGGLNEIVSDQLPETQLDAILDAAIATYRNQGLHFRWTLMPGATPTDLPARLARRGLTPTPTHLVARPTEGPAPAPDPAIEVREVTAADVDVFTRVSADGWGEDPAPLAVLHRRSLAQRPQRTHLFLARHGGEPAGAAASMELERSTYLLGAIVLPELRRRGVYQALIHARLAHAAARGFRCATSIARVATSSPILVRLGFEILATLDELVDR